MEDMVKYYRVWRCQVVSSGYSVSSRCSPSEPHSEDWNCRWVLEGPTFIDNQGARDLLARYGIEVIG